MAKSTWLAKLIVAIFGLAILLAGVAIVNAHAKDWIETVLLFTAAAVLFGSVGYKTLLDGEFKTDDLLNALALVFAVITTIAAISSLIFFQFSLPVWISVVAAWVTIIIGVFIVIYGLMLKEA